MPELLIVVVVATAEEVLGAYVIEADSIPTWLEMLLKVIFTAFVPSGKLLDEIVKFVDVIPVEV